jgi:hypothetical protein
LILLIAARQRRIFAQLQPQFTLLAALRNERVRLERKGIVIGAFVCVVAIVNPQLKCIAVFDGHGWETVEAELELAVGMVEEGDRLVVDGVPAALVELLELEGVDNVGEGDLGSAGVEFFADEGGALSGGLRVFGREGQQKVDADDYEDLPATVAAFLWLLCVLRHFHYTISHTLTYRTLQ